MDIIKAIVLGIVQGLTEFLPVSSSGHLIFFKKLFGLEAESFGLTFDIALHIATLVAVIVVLWGEIVPLLKKPFQKYVYLLVVATVPAGIVGILFDDVIEEISQSGGFLGIAFLITAVVLWLSEKIGKKVKDKENMTYKDALVIGGAQAIAVMPGISRSGSTLSAGLITGLKKEPAVNFAFLMSIPIIGASAVLGVKNILEAPAAFDWTIVVAGMIAAGISGYFAVKFMVDFFKKHSTKIFSIYVAVLGLFVLVDQLFFQMFFDTFLVFKM
ncbi:MAG: undecaprenyl-diphosphate phosphatase [Ruminococcaceae bacterium]|nr:undecaprenyl-diphosphate phosphatase [Oscillospiraceae bacterium]